MNRQDLLRHIAEYGYDVGFGAKKHLSTYDIVTKIPSVIGFISIAIGILALVYDDLSKKPPSAALLILGVLGMVVSIWDKEKDIYAKTGSEITDIFNNLKSLYFQAKTASDDEINNIFNQANDLKGQFNKISIQNQIFFSGWLAHYKFFWEMQIGWIDEQLHFKFFRDKVPLSLTITMVLPAVIWGGYGVCAAIKHFLAAYS